MYSSAFGWNVLQIIEVFWSINGRLTIISVDVLSGRLSNCDSVESKSSLLLDWSLFFLLCLMVSRTSGSFSISYKSICNCYIFLMSWSLDIIQLLFVSPLIFLFWNLFYQIPVHLHFLFSNSLDWTIASNFNLCVLLFWSYGFIVGRVLLGLSFLNPYIQLVLFN